MDCPNWPPPLPSLPLYPPCRPPEPPPPEPQPKESQTQEWWNQYLGPAFIRASGKEGVKKGITYELTSRQRRDLLLVKTRTREDKLIWSVPLPASSYPRDGLPIWERLYLDRKLPMLKSPPDALVFARQKIGKKLWQDTKGQEFILYDPNSYEVKFSYENVHDPHLTMYYQGKAIRGFLLKLGDATEDGWGLCSLKRFNQYRNYLKRVHLSLVHTEMKKQDALKNEINQIEEYKRITQETMALFEKKAILDEIKAALIEGLRQERLNRHNRILASIQSKEERVRRLYKRRAKEKERNRQRGLRLRAEQELKNKISREIQRRKKIATLRMWHRTEEETMKNLKKLADEKSRQKAEKVRIRWQNKIDNLKVMLEKEDECLKLQEKVRAENVAIRKNLTERLKQKEKDRFQDIRKQSLRKRALMKKEKEDKNMEEAIIKVWFSVNKKNFDVATEIYRVKKSINSTMAELLSSQMEGPDRFSIILLSRNRIQREQKIPLQVSLAIDAVLETSIQKWANIRLMLILETVVNQVILNGFIELARIKAKNKQSGEEFDSVFRASEPRGEIYQKDSKIGKPKQKKSEEKESTDHTFYSTTNDGQSQEVARSQVSNSEKEASRTQEKYQTPTAAIPNYVHFGPVTSYEYRIEYEPTEELKPVANRPKTPMPTQKILCEAGFLEEKLSDILPTFSNDDVCDLKEKRKFRKVFRSVATQLFMRSIATAKEVFEPVTRVRAINKLVYLGETDKETLVNTLCCLIMNMKEKAIYLTDDFDWLSKAVARKAIEEVLDPPEFRKEPQDEVARTKIMFYAPKQKPMKKS